MTTVAISFDTSTPLALLLTVLALAAFVVKVFTLIDAVTRRADAFVAASKQTKIFWTLILGIAVAWNFFFPQFLSIINLIGLVAALVYLVDVRPALREVGGGRRKPPSSGW